jgi:3-oxoacyl-[acyl-carrier-protein] synthase II
MSLSRVVVTAVGVISPLALDSTQHFQQLLAGDSAVSPLEGSEYRNYPPVLQACVKDFDRRQFIPDRMLRKLLSPSPAFALASSTEALRNADLDPADFTDCGLYVGSVCLDANPEALIPALRASINEHDELSLDRFVIYGMGLVDPLFLVKSLPNAGLCAIAIQHQILGPNANITNGGASGIQALRAAFEAIRHHEAEIAVAGAYDSLLQMDSVVEHLLAGRLVQTTRSPERSCRPFDRNRSGYALGEGAAFFILESLSHARRRGAKVCGEILSFGDTTQSSLLLQRGSDDGETLSLAALEVLESAGISAREVDAVFGDGTAVADDDERECRAYERVFGDSGPAFTAATGAIGYTGAASGAFSLVHACLALSGGVLPPLINCDDPVRDCPLPIVRQKRAADLGRVLVWNSDRGIKNTAVLVSACLD